MKEKVYSIAVDIGTASIGWAAINEQYKLLKLKGRDAWGAYLFTDAVKAVDRRKNRSQRRRYDRRRERISLLQDIMGNLVLGVDDSFFIKLKESSLKSNIDIEMYSRSNTYNLFEGDYTDKDYYKEFKTIYHLRNKLASSTEKADPRLIYLALHHIIKYRGNFLFEGKKIDLNGGMLKQSLEDFFNLLSEEWGMDFNYSGNAVEIVNILKNRTLVKTKKIDSIKSLLPQKQYKKFIEAFLNVILGNKASFKDLIFSDEDINGEDDKPIKISFRSDEYDKNEDMYLQLANDKNLLLIAIKSIYTAILFDKVTNGCPTISEAMICKYEKHKEDLKIFKSLMKEAFPIEINQSTGKPYHSEYSKMFISLEGSNYVNYVGTNLNGRHYEKRVATDEAVKKARVAKDEAVKKARVAKDVFYEAVKKVLEKVPNVADKEYCLQQIELDNFLPLLNSVENTAIPYQMNLKEMEQILNNQGKFYPELIDNKDKIISILTFKRPYYVGTLKGKYSWCDQVINEKITPWNFYDLVDTDSLSEKFILRMTNHCTIFKEEECLPLNSIIYQSYVTLNEINKIKFKKSPIAIEWKKSIFKNLCCKFKRVTQKAIISLLKKQFNLEIVEGDITGLADEEVNGTMGTYIDFAKRLENGFNINNLDAYEETIRTLTIFDDEKLRFKRIKSQNIYSENEIKLLSKLRYNKWGRFSRKLLHGILSNSHESIVTCLYNSDKHINELLFNDEFGYKEQLPNSEEKIEKFDYERDVKDLYCSPSVKKSIWNTLKIIEEIVKVAKCPPRAIFLEDTHTETAKKKPKSRTKILVDLYKSIKNDIYFDKDVESELLELHKNKDKLNKDKLYLWLLQLGRCMYSNEPISIDALEGCQIDHIVPRSYIKDDSFENKVLVKSIENQKKTDTLALNFEIRKRMAEFWKFLYDKKFIGNKKYNNLIKAEFTAEDKVGFINRQLVETSQTIKEVEKILRKKYKNIEIRGIRAGLNSCIRLKYGEEKSKAGFNKIRSLNNLHHAKDAYLTAVLGQFTTIACPMWGQDKRNIELKYDIAHYDNEKDVKKANYKQYGIIVDLMENGDESNFELTDEENRLWDSMTFTNVLDTMGKNTCIIVKKLKTPSSTFYKQTIYGPKQGKSKLSPIKCKHGVPMPTELYGGYSAEQYCCFTVVKYEEIKKNATVVKYDFIGIPVKVMAMDKQNGTELNTFLKEKYKNTTVEIVKKVNKFQLISYNNHLCYITGERELINAVELIVDSKFEKLLYLIEKNNIKKLSETYKDKLNDLIKEFIYHYVDKVKCNMPIFEKYADRMERITDVNYDKMSIEQKIKFIKDLLTVSNTTPQLAAFDKNLYYSINENGCTKKSIVNNEEKNEEGRMQIKIKPHITEWINYSCTGLYKSITKLK